MRSNDVSDTQHVTRFDGAEQLLEGELDWEKYLIPLIQSSARTSQAIPTAVVYIRLLTVRSALSPPCNLTPRILYSEICVSISHSHTFPPPPPHHHHYGNRRFS